MSQLLSLAVSVPGYHRQYISHEHDGVPIKLELGTLDFDMLYYFHMSQKLLFFFSPNNLRM